jgi:hypothetical protein
MQLKRRLARTLAVIQRTQFITPPQEVCALSEGSYVIVVDEQFETFAAYLFD